MEKSFNIDLKWIFIFLNVFVILISLQSFFDKIERIEDKIDKVSIQCDSLQNELKTIK